MTITTRNMATWTPDDLRGGAGATSAPKITLTSEPAQDWKRDRIATEQTTGAVERAWLLAGKPPWSTDERASISQAVDEAVAVAREEAFKAGAKWAREMIRGAE